MIHHGVALSTNGQPPRPLFPRYLLSSSSQSHQRSQPWPSFVRARPHSPRGAHFSNEGLTDWVSEWVNGSILSINTMLWLSDCSLFLFTFIHLPTPRILLTLHTQQRHSLFTLPWRRTLQNHHRQEVHWRDQLLLLYIHTLRWIPAAISK